MGGVTCSLRDLPSELRGSSELTESMRLAKGSCWLCCGMPEWIPALEGAALLQSLPRMLSNGDPRGLLTTPTLVALLLLLLLLPLPLPAVIPVIMEPLAIPAFTDRWQLVLRCPLLSFMGKSMEGSRLLFMSGGQKGDKDWPRSQLGMVGSVTLPGDMTLTRLAELPAP